MFGVSSLELLLIFIIGLLILGPERLPRVAAQIGRWVAKARRTANQLRYQLEREVALDELYKSQKKQPPKRPVAPADPPASADSATSTHAADDNAAGGAPAADPAQESTSSTAPTSAVRADAEAAPSAASAQDASVSPPATVPPAAAPVSRDPGSSEIRTAGEPLETTTADAAGVEERR